MTSPSKTVWHACSACGRDWPFPMGVPPEVDPVTHERREWHCQVCASAVVAKMKRALGDLSKRMHGTEGRWQTQFGGECVIYADTIDRWADEIDETANV